MFALQSGLALSLRSVIVMGTYVFATSMVASLGSVTLAASEIMRQARLPNANFSCWQLTKLSTCLL